LREDYVAPRYNVDAFNCPWCNAYAQQDWYELMFEPREGAVLEVVEGTEISICIAETCIGKADNGGT